MFLNKSWKKFYDGFSLITVIIGLSVVAGGTLFIIERNKKFMDQIESSRSLANLDQAVNDVKNYLSNPVNCLNSLTSNRTPFNSGGNVAVNISYMGVIGATSNSKIILNSVVMKAAQNSFNTPNAQTYFQHQGNQVVKNLHTTFYDREIALTFTVPFGDKNGSSVKKVVDGIFVRFAVNATSNKVDQCYLMGKGNFETTTNQKLCESVRGTFSNGICLSPSSSDFPTQPFANSSNNSSYLCQHDQKKAYNQQQRLTTLCYIPQYKGCLTTGKSGLFTMREGTSVEISSVTIPCLLNKCDALLTTMMTDDFADVTMNSSQNALCGTLEWIQGNLGISLGIPSLPPELGGDLPGCAKTDMKFDQRCNVRDPDQASQYWNPTQSLGHIPTNPLYTPEAVASFNNENGGFVSYVGNIKNHGSYRYTKIRWGCSKTCKDPVLGINFCCRWGPFCDFTSWSDC